MSGVGIGYNIEVNGGSNEVVNKCYDVIGHVCSRAYKGEGCATLCINDFITFYLVLSGMLAI